MQDADEYLRLRLLETCQQLAESGLNQGTSGNVSVRCREGLLITPSGMAVDEVTTDDLVKMQWDGSFDASQTPSSEWRFHLDILRSRPEMHAVIHTHSLFATALSTLRREVPAFHYMIAIAGGDTIRCAPYALFGSQILSDFALTALQDRKACLLANHGMIAVERNLAKAFNVAQTVETLCEQYITALQVGAPYILSSQEMLAVHLQFKGYGGWADEQDN